MSTQTIAHNSRTLGRHEVALELMVERRHRQRRQADYELAATAQQVGFWYGSFAGAITGALFTLAVIYLYKFIH
jgi:hypothetical protein